VVASCLLEDLLVACFAVAVFAWVAVAAVSAAVVAAASASASASVAAAVAAGAVASETCRRHVCSPRQDHNQVDRLYVVHGSTDGSSCRMVGSYPSYFAAFPAAAAASYQVAWSCH